MSKTINDGSVNLEIFPASRVRQLVKMIGKFKGNC